MNLKPAAQLLKRSQALVIGHRGFSKRAPENTQPSFEAALEFGADLIELDYQTTRDGQSIVFHDDDLKRTTNGGEIWFGQDLRIKNRRFNEIEKLDAGSWFGNGFSNTKILTLEEAIEYILKQGGVPLIEHKSGKAEDCARLLGKRDWINEVLIQSFDPAFLNELHQLIPAQSLGLLGPGRTKSSKSVLNKAFVKEALSLGGRFIGWDMQVSEEAVVFAHQQGLKVLVYTVNKAQEMLRLLDMGVNGIISDDVALAMEVVGKGHGV